MNTKIQVIDSIEGFQNLKEDWNKLYDECPDATIFSSWDWMFTWWEVFHRSLNTRLFIVCLYEDNQLIGIAPFHIMGSFPKSIIQGKTISFIGSGEKYKDKIVSQFMDFIVKPDKQQQMVSLICTYLIENKKKWDFADFEFLLKNSLISQCFNSKDSVIQKSLSQYGNRFYISEIKDFDDFQYQMGNRWSKMYKKKSRKLEKDGDAKIKLANDIDKTKDAFKQLARMHNARWKNRTDVSIFESKLFNQFHLKIIERLVPQNKAFINTLSLNDEALASYYCFTDKAQIHYYQSGFYSEHANRYSPLFLLVCKEIGAAIKRNALFDFMFDEDFDSYKKEQYAAQCKPMYRLMWSPYKSRMIKHNYAKSIQKKYLGLKCSIEKSKKIN